MTTGAYISGAAHVLLILFLVFGGLFTRSRLPEVTVADVSVISAEEFAAMTASDAQPQVMEEAAAPEGPVVSETPQIATPLEDTATPTAETAAPAPPLAETAPEPEAAPEPAPTAEPEVIAALPAPDTPAPVDTAPPAPQEAAPAPAPRVAPEPAAPAPPDALDAPVVVEERTPEPAAEPEPEEVASAPEEATTEIVTEAEEKPRAPTTSPPPMARPARPAPSAVAEAAPAPGPDPAPAPAEPAPAANAAADPIADAVAAALAEAQTPAAPSGPPLNFGEKEAFRVAVSRCWDVDVGGRSADVTVTVGISMNPDGTVVGGAVRQISASGGDSTAQRTAFEKARRAILRCQSGGFPLPAEKYAQWREIEMTFNPEGMRLK